MNEDDILTMGEKVTMCLSPLGMLRLETMQRPTRYLAESTPEESFLALAAALGAMDVPLKKLNAAILSIAEDMPNEKELARQRSRDDIKSKRKQFRRDGNMYRRSRR